MSCTSSFFIADNDTRVLHVSKESLVTPALCYIVCYTTVRNTNSKTQIGFQWKLA